MIATIMAGMENLFTRTFPAVEILGRYSSLSQIYLKTYYYDKELEAILDIVLLRNYDTVYDFLL
jgi:hypothetical protein